MTWDDLRWLKMSWNNLKRLVMTWLDLRWHNLWADLLAGLWACRPTCGPACGPACGPTWGLTCGPICGPIYGRTDLWADNENWVPLFFSFDHLLKVLLQWFCNIIALNPVSSVDNMKYVDLPSRTCISHIFHGHIFLYILSTSSSILNSDLIAKLEIVSYTSRIHHNLVSILINLYYRSYFDLLLNFW